MKRELRAVAARPRKRLAIAIAAGLMTGASAAVSAATFTVSSPADTGPGSLREAVSLANQTAGPDIIEFNAGLGQIVLQSEITISETLQINGPVGQQVIRGAGTSRLLAVRTSGAVITLQNLLLENGRSIGPAGDACGTYTSAASYGDGGAVCSIDDVTLVGTTITGSAISGDYISGGGLFALGNVTLTNSTVSNNASQGQAARGGGLFVGGDLTMSDSVVSGNSTDGEFAFGGGLSVDGNLSVYDSTISGNTTNADSSRGGGIEVGGDLLLQRSALSDNITLGDGSFGGGGVVEADVEIIDSRITDNRTDGASALGGGLVGFSPAMIRNSEISGNRTRGTLADGGGLALQATAEIIDSTISGNATEGADSDDGGATIFGQATIINSTISGNSAQGAGARTGGLRIGGGDAVVANSTITGNFAAAGPGGLLFQVVEDQTYTMTLSSTVLAGNSGPEGNLLSQPGFGSIVIDVSSSLFGDAVGEINGLNLDNLFSDATGLGPLADNGCAVTAGPAAGSACVSTHLPAPDSLVIDAGSNPLALTDDQRGSGFPRSLGLATDIGALESAPVPPPPPPPPVPADLMVAKSDGNVLASPGERLTWTISYANGGELPAQDVVLIETVPESTRIDPDLTGEWLCDGTGAAGDTCQLAIGTLAAGTQGSTRFGVIVDPEATSDSIVNRVEIIGSDSQTLDPNPDNNLALETTPLSRIGKLPMPERRLSADGVRSGVGDPDGAGGPSRLGEAAASGDFNGDGLADVAIGAPGADVLLLVLGRPFEADAVALPLSEFPSMASPGYRVESADGLGGLGDRIAGVRDVNGDGLDDLLFADRSVALDPLVGPVAGSFVLPGFDPPPAFVVDQNNRLAPEDGIVLQRATGDPGAFIGALSGAGDFNGDGLSDFLLVSGAGFGSDLPQVSLVFGTPELQGFTGQQWPVQAQAGAQGLLLTQAAGVGGNFGASLSAVGDFNGDGIEDIAIGEPRPGGGLVHLLFGDQQLASSFEGQLDISMLDGRIGLTLAGGGQAVRFGSRVTGAGDVDGDGYDDLLISELRPDGEPGRVHLVFGTAAPLPAMLDLDAPGDLRVSRIVGAVANDRLGQASAGLGDIDGDGLDDIALGAPGMAERIGDQPPAPDTGRVFVLFGSIDLPPELSIAALEPSQGYALVASEASIGFGSVVDGPGDFDGDGVPDLLVTAPGVAFDGVAGFGQYWIVSGSQRPAPAGQALEILEFTALPDSVIAGESFTLSWNALPDDIDTRCSGSGLPGTSWNGGGKPASGSETIDSSSLPAGSYTAVLECERDNQQLTAAADLEILLPPTDLALSGGVVALPFGDSVFVQFDVANTGSEPAQVVELELALPAGYAAQNFFRLAPSCMSDVANGSGEVRCDAAEIADWQCEIDSAEPRCTLTELPVGGLAGVLFQLDGQGMATLEAAVRAANAAEQAINLVLEP